MNCKVIYLNIFEGCKDTCRFARIVKFVKKNKPNVLCLSELNDWEKNNSSKLKKFMKTINMNNVIFGISKKNFHIAIFTNLNIIKKKLIHKNFDTGMIKGTFKINNKQFSIILTHLSPKTEDVRLKEIDIILKNISKEPTILLGDLNSLSPDDIYDEKALIQKLHKISSEKFGIYNLRKNVISRILKYGLVDTVKTYSKKFEYSVPTAINTDKFHLSKLRLDYIFMTNNLLYNLINSKIIRNKFTNTLSDHFPIIAEFRF